MGGGCAVGEAKSSLVERVSVSGGGAVGYIPGESAGWWVVGGMQVVGGSTINGGIWSGVGRGGGAGKLRCGRVSLDEMVYMRRYWLLVRRVID